MAWIQLLSLSAQQKLDKEMITSCSDIHSFFCAGLLLALAHRFRSIEKPLVRGGSEAKGEAPSPFHVQRQTAARNNSVARRVGRGLL